MFAIAKHTSILAASFALTLLVLPGGTIAAQATPYPTDHSYAVLAPTRPVTPSPPRPCFLARANWNLALDGGQPFC